MLKAECWTKRWKTTRPTCPQDQNKKKITKWCENKEIAENDLSNSSNLSNSFKRIISWMLNGEHNLSNSSNMCPCVFCIFKSFLYAFILRLKYVLIFHQLIESTLFITYSKGLNMVGNNARYPLSMSASTLPRECEMASMDKFYTGLYCGKIRHWSG